MWNRGTYFKVHTTTRYDKDYGVICWKCFGTMKIEHVVMARFIPSMLREWGWRKIKGKWICPKHK